jgi:hypothetical protein
VSRHIIPNAPGSPPGRVTTVGWDAPLNTFFGMAFDQPASGDVLDDEVEVFWVGGMPDEIKSIPALARRLAEHGVDLPAHIAAALVSDSAYEGDRSAGRPGTRLIKAMTECNGLCLTAADVGVPVDGNPVAYPHPDCGVHGASEARQEVAR